MKRAFLSAVALLSGVFLAPPARAAERPLVAVFAMEDRGSALAPEVVSNLGAYLEARLAEGGYQVIPQDQLRERIAQEKQGSFQACFDESCQIELGRELSAQKILSTRILKIGDTCQVTSTLYDLKKAAAELAATAGGPCQEGALLGAVQEIARKLVEPLRAAGGDSAPVVSPAPVSGPPPQPASAAPPLAVARTHGNFFLRMCAGAGFARSSTQGTVVDKENYVLGGGTAAAASIGYFIAPNVAVHGDLFGITLIEPQNYLNNERQRDLAGQYTLGALGAGITWFFSPNDWFVSAAAGMGVIRAKLGDFETETRAGFAGSVLAGKQWWVANDWSLGVAAQVMYNTVPVRDDNLQHTFAASVLFIAAYD
ncbi:MAG: hypothetical protein GYA21_17375 [Myxococcales bacterium]|nr:hypothetical protein [Myxococcales bacterium]